MALLVLGLGLFYLLLGLGLSLRTGVLLVPAVVALGGIYAFEIPWVQEVSVGVVLPRHSLGRHAPPAFFVFVASYVVFIAWAFVDSRLEWSAKLRQLAKGTRGGR